MSDASEFKSRDSKENDAVMETADGVSGAPSELDSGAPSVIELDARVSRNGKSEDAVAGSDEEFRVRVDSEGDGDRVDSGNESSQGQIDRHHRHFRPQEDAKKFPGSDSKSLLSEFDEFVAAEGNGGARSVAAEGNGGARSRASRDLGFGLEVGDMVWGKVKSHPWWPGHIYNEAFATPSVRRSKREGHVLVAFFGDSSYGWFEPAELIPFDQNFAEKSQQIHSRTFLKAVEEAVDEVSRRRALGLSCRCRNPENFAPTAVKGYFSVDVPDYEPGGFYSSNQIRKARNSFKPGETLAFVKQLAMAPRGGGERESIGFTKNKSTVFAYRKAVFEQYDETYAQAFGAQPLRPSHPQNRQLNQPLRQPPKAPLSGPMVIAEALGGGKNATKSVKVKDGSKKDKYLFKRRDDPSNSLQLANREETPNKAGRYLLQKRAPFLPVAPHNLEKEGTAKEALICQAQPDGSVLASQAISSDAKLHLDKTKASSEGMTCSFEPDDVSSKSLGRSDLSGEGALLSTVDETSQPYHLESKVSVDIKHDGNAELTGRHDEQGLPTISDGGNGMHQVKSENKVHSSPVEAKNHNNSVVKKIKGHKRSADDLNSKTCAIGERKKKKKKDFDLHPTSGHLEKQSDSGKSSHLSGKPVSISLTPTEDFPAEQVQVDISTHIFPPMNTTGDVSFELPQLLGDLQVLALDPFHGVERKIPAAVQQFFLRFRSLVYQKSLILSPPTENEAPEVRVSKSPSRVRASDSPDDHVKASPHVKPVKKRIVRPDDPTIAGRKRAPSDRQEEIAAKRLKKIKHLKTLAAEKGVASQKASEARRGEGKVPIPQAPPKLVKPDLARKAERPAKTVEPTTLVIKFPPQTSLPSIAELKARYARFGPMDQSGFRVFWKSSTCRVVFLHKAAAQAAYKYSVSNQSLFGNVGVRCFLRESEDSAPEVSEAAKPRTDDGVDETPRVKDPSFAHRPASLSSQAQQALLPQPMVQLKSILKKSTGDESGQVSGNGGSSSKGSPRVKFMLGGEESISKGEQLMMSNRNNFNNSATSFADGGAMDFNSKNVQKVTTSQPPLLPIPLAATTTSTPFMKTPQHNLNNSEARNTTPNYINNIASPATTTSVDISQQMISLLTRCSDVVTNVTGLLGYVPYHPL